VSPLVSIFMFVRNGAPSVRRAVDSVLAQAHPNIEFVVQDAASTDGTLEILKSYGQRIKLVSEPDAGPHEGLWRVLARCTGERRAGLPGRT
jgi:glycosyltransferase involved in cell wall biosynthesis